jgi:hypothetical protein
MCVAMAAGELCFMTASAVGCECRNCEDIAMSFLVANATSAPPLWVKGRLFEIGSTGISSLQGHSEHRTQCVNHFVSVYGYMPLVASHVKVVDAQHQWLW